MNKQTTEQELSNWIQHEFERLWPEDDLDGTPLQVSPATDEKFGDYQCNAAMGLAKVLRRSPREIAQRFEQEASLHDAVQRLEIAGPGFINLHLHDGWLARRVETMEKDASLGVPRVGEDRTVILDYSSPNIAKPMHIGHIRSTVIGNALDRLHRFLGYKVISDNHLGDWGTQFGLLILGYRHFLDEEALQQRPAEELERVYVESYSRSEEDPDWKDEARNELVKLQQGDPSARELWQTFIDLSLQEFQRIYSRLGVRFDYTRGESFYNDDLPQVLEELKEQKLVEVSEGAEVIRLEEDQLPVAIVRKRDGGYNYTTTDLATVRSRIREFSPDAIIYVTDERQQLHFRQFFTIAKKMGWETNLVHVWFGLMRLPEATFSTRQGNVIKLEALLDEAVRRAQALVDDSSPEMPEATRATVAEAVGIGAVKYADLSQNPQSLVTFTWEKAMALDGNSAPYLQYAHARIRSVLDRYKATSDAQDLDRASIELGDAVERRLAVKLLQFPEAVVSAAAHYKPNILCDYLFQLSQLYSSFYQTVPFLKAPEGIRESRLRLGRCTAAVLKQGLDLLGISAPDRI